MVSLEKKLRLHLKEEKKSVLRILNLSLRRIKKFRRLEKYKNIFTNIKIELKKIKFDDKLFLKSSKEIKEEVKIRVKKMKSWFLKLKRAIKEEKRKNLRKKFSKKKGFLVNFRPIKIVLSQRIKKVLSRKKKRNCGREFVNGIKKMFITSVNYNLLKLIKFLKSECKSEKVKLGEDEVIKKKLKLVEKCYYRRIIKMIKNFEPEKFYKEIWGKTRKQFKLRRKEKKKKLLKKKIYNYKRKKKFFLLIRTRRLLKILRRKTFFFLVIKSVFNNTFLTIITKNGKTLYKTSTGMNGYKGPKRTTYLASLENAKILAKKLNFFHYKSKKKTLGIEGKSLKKKERYLTVILKSSITISNVAAALKGFGGKTKFKILRIISKLNRSYNGCKARKARRV